MAMGQARTSLARCFGKLSIPAHQPAHRCSKRPCPLPKAKRPHTFTGSCSYEPKNCRVINYQQFYIVTTFLRMTTQKPQLYPKT